MGAGFRTFQSGEILTASNVQNYLMDQAVMVFAGTAERGSALPTPETGMTAYSTATGLQVYNGSAWSAVSSVVQVKSTTKTDTFTMSSSTFADVTGLSVSITPTSASNKVLVIVNVNGQGTASTAGMYLRLLRGATSIAAGDASGTRTTVAAMIAAGIFIGNTISSTITFLDSPATTSATTYKIQIASQAGANTMHINRAESDTDDPGRGRAASTITVMEVTP
jgi:hypothetical protein